MPTDDVTLYVASRVSRATMWRGLRHDGWPIISTWIDEAGEGETGDFGELWNRIHSEIASAAGVIFYGDVTDAPWKGALVEVGIAMGLGKPIAAVIIGDVDGRTSRPIGSWINSPLVTICNSVEFARDAIKSRAALRPPAPAVAQMWDAPGPQVAHVDSGREPTLREVLMHYYTSSGITVATAKSLTNRYIALATPPTAQGRNCRRCPDGDWPGDAEPGGMECNKCGCIFIGNDGHPLCKVCAPTHNDSNDRGKR